MPEPMNCMIKKEWNRTRTEVDQRQHSLTQIGWFGRKVTEANGCHGGDGKVNGGNDGEVPENPTVDENTQTLVQEQQIQGKSQWEATTKMRGITTLGRKMYRKGKFLPSVEQRH